MDPRVRNWTAFILAFLSLAGIPSLQYSLERVERLPPAWISLGRLVLAGFLLLAVALPILLLALRTRMKAKHLEGVTILLFAMLTLAPMTGKMVGRLIAGSDRFNIDSILQVEIASGMIAEGRNPYTEDYFGTELEGWHQGIGRSPLYHLVYPPLPVLLTLPLREACLAAFGMYDTRFILIPVLVATFLIARRCWRGNPWSPALLAAAFVNPLFIVNFHVGRWDSLIFLFWTLALWAAAARRPLTMAALLALAALTKTTMFPAALFGLAYVCRSRRDAVRWTVTYAAISLSLLLPFVLWDPGALYDDLFGALSGRGAHPFPINDAGPYGFSSLVIALGWVSSPMDYFPFWIVQVPVTLLMAAVGLRELRRHRSLAVMGLAFALTTGAFIYFSRIPQRAYLGALVTMAILAIGFAWKETDDVPERPNPATPG